MARLSANLPAELADVVETLADTVVQVRVGTIPANLGNSVASLCRAFIHAHSAASDQERIRIFEETLDKLETVVTQARTNPALKVV